MLWEMKISYILHAPACDAIPAMSHAATTWWGLREQGRPCSRGTGA